MKTDKKLYYIIFGMIVFALVFGFICRITVLANEAEPKTESTTEDHLSQEELDHILRVSEQWLKNNTVPEVQTATSTDADFDTHAYFTYDLDQEWFDETTPEYKMLDDIYRMILSIRNCIIILIMGLLVVWVHKMVKSIILSFGKGGRNT